MKKLLTIILFLFSLTVFCQSNKEVYHVNKVDVSRKLPTEKQWKAFTTLYDCDINVAYVFADDYDTLNYVLVDGNHESLDETIVIHAKLLVLNNEPGLDVKYICSLGDGSTTTIFKYINNLMWIHTSDDGYIYKQTLWYEK